jgi:hypothetical protein
MIPIKTPEYMDALIRSGARLQNGPAVDNTSGLNAAFGAQQMADLEYTKNRGRQLTSAEDNFNRSLKFQKQQLDRSKNMDNIANILSAANLGLTGVSRYQEKNRAKEYKAERQKMIDKLRSNDNEQNKMWADWLEFYMQR